MCEWNMLTTDLDKHLAELLSPREGSVVSIKGDNFLVFTKSSENTSQACQNALESTQSTSVWVCLKLLDKSKLRRFWPIQFCSIYPAHYLRVWGRESSIWHEPQELICAIKEGKVFTR